MPREAPSINLFESWHLSVLEPREQIALGAPVRIRSREFSSNDARDLRLRRFGIGRVHPVVPDHRRRHDDRLTAIRWIGEHLLVAGHVRREHDLGDGWFVATEEASAKKGSILEEEEPLSTATLSHVCYGFFAGGCSTAFLAPVAAFPVGGVVVAGAVALGAGVNGIAGFAPPAGALAGAVIGGVVKV